MNITTASNITQAHVTTKQNEHVQPWFYQSDVNSY